MNTRFSSSKLNEIISDLITSIESSKQKAFGFYESTSEKIAKTSNELVNTNKELERIVEDIKEKTSKSKRYREELIKVTRALRVDSEEHQLRYEDAYKKADILMLEVNSLEDRHSRIFRKKNQLDRQLKEQEDFLADSEDLIQSISSSMMYLDGDLSEIGHKLNENEEILLSLIKASETEKKKISRDVHDGPAQMIAFSLIELQLLKEYVTEDCSPNALSSIEKIEGSIKSALKDLRHIIYDLRPMTLDDLGLVSVLEEYVASFNNDTELLATFTLIDEDNLVEQIPSAINVVIFRAIQESLNNAFKHSKANTITVNLEIFKENLNITIIDNGIGFDLEKDISKRNKYENFGLLGMRERVNIVNGKMKIKSLKNKGTNIKISIPWQL